MYKICGIDIAQNKPAIIESLEKLPEINAVHLILDPAKILLFLDKEINIDTLIAALNSVGDYCLEPVPA